MAANADELLANLDWVRALAARLVFDPTAREDLEQDIWHAALRRPPAHGVPLRAWLTGVARHLAALMHRGDGRRRRRELAAVRTGDAPSAQRLAEHAELQQRLLAAVNTLPAEMRDVVLLRFVEGQPPRAIARHLGVPVATVNTRLQRAQQRLRERLDADFGDRRAWRLAFAALARPRHVAAVAGVLPTLGWVALTAMKTHKLLAAAALVLVLAAIPTTILLARRGPPAPPDYGTDAPVASLFERSHAPDAEPKVAAANARETAAPVRAFTGRVVGADGAPIAGARVTKQPLWLFADRVDEGRMAAADAATTSAADGTFTLSDVGAGPNGLGVAAELADHIARDETTPCRPGEPATIVMLRTFEVPLTVDVVERTTRVLPPRFVVIGSTHLATRDYGRGPVPTRELKQPDEAEARNGSWRGTARCVVGMPFHVLVRCSGQGRDSLGDGTDPVPRATAMPEPGQPLHLSFEVDFDQAERIAPRVQRGRIVDAATQAPLAGIDVCTFHGEGRSSFYRYVQSRADGTFTLALPAAGPCTIGIEHPDWQPEKQPEAAGELVFALRPRASLTVRLVDPSQQPIARAHVLVRSRRNEDFHRRMRTDADGAIVLERLLAGDYTVFVVPARGSPDEHAITSATWNVEPGQHVVATMPIEPPGAVRVMGTVVGGDIAWTPAFVPFARDGRLVHARRQGSQYDAGGLAPGDYLVVLLGKRDGADSALLGGVVRIAGLGPRALDVSVPTATVRGRLVTSRSDRASWRVVAVPAGLQGPAAELVAGEKFTKVLGVAIAGDDTFALPDIADGELELQVRAAAEVLARRPIRVRGGLDVGDWPIGR